MNPHLNVKERCKNADWVDVIVTLNAFFFVRIEKFIPG